jgi:peptide/nickel transport system substrate-binding protein
MMRRPALAALTAFAFGISTLGAVGCGGGEPEQSAQSAKRGGIYRVQSEAFNFSGGFDPTGEYFTSALGLYSCCLIRTLMGYKHVAGPEGNELIPDLAAKPPEVSPDRLAYTFTLRDGVRFGPPVNREVTSEDVAYAFERIGTPSLVAQYGFYYDVIEGMAEFKAGAAKTISGIQTPDERTISFRLTEPTGDFPFRLAEPATGPIPKEVAGCFTEAGEYGRNVVSTGPYMIAGSENVDLSRGCDSIKPASGWDPESHLRLVRNPNYDPATDTKEARENFLNGIDFTLNENTTDIYRRIRAGELEGEVQTSPPGAVLREYSRSESLKDRLQIHPGDATLYLSINLTQPPFDDIHVRKAANLAMDKASLQRAWGGPLAGAIAHHIVPDPMFGNELADYKPYGTPDDAGDVEAAKEEMRQSKYDANGDGLCDAPVCNDVFHVANAQAPWPAMEPVIEESFAKIGIKLKTRAFTDAFPIIQNVSRNIPITSVPGWGKDYADASTFMVLFNSAGIQATGGVNYSLVGLTSRLARRVKASGTVNGIPSVDSDIEECSALSGEERQTCWQELDKKLMEEVVPWIPYLSLANVDVIGPAVTKYESDQFSGEPAYSHLAVDPSAQK